MNKSKLLWATFFICSVLVCSFAVAYFVVPEAYKQGYEEGYGDGYVKSLNDVKDLLGKNGITFAWTDLGNGQYQINVYMEYGQGVLTTIGQDWIEQQISGAVNATQKALYCADSNSASAPDSAWTQLPT